MLGKVLALSSVLTIASLGALIAICPSQSPSCIDTASYEGGSAAFFVFLVATFVSVLGYGLNWRNRLKALSRGTAMLLPPVSFACPHCGAPNDAAAGVTSLRCPYCGDTNVVPRPAVRLQFTPASIPKNLPKVGGTCDVCGKALTKEETNKFDSTFRGKRKYGERLTLCTEHLISKFSQYVSSFEHSAVVVYPMPRDPPVKGQPHPNAYQYYSFDEMPKEGWDREYIEGLRALLPKSRISCRICGTRQAAFAWCSPDIYSNRYTSSKLNDAIMFAMQLVCKDCLVTAFSARVRELGLWFDEFNPPVDADGFATSFEV